MTAPVGKTEPARDGSTSSIGSSPEPETQTYTQENPQQQKRKGGRKPVSTPLHAARHARSAGTISHHVKDRTNQAP